MSGIRIAHLCKRFGTRRGTFTAIEDVSLEIPAGTFLTIVGPSGCGKTTLLRIVAGLESFTGGTLEIANASSGKPENSMVFQGESIFPWMTVWDNAAYGLRMRKVPAKTIKDVVSHYLDRTGLTRFAGYLERIGLDDLGALAPAVVSAFVTDQSPGLGRTSVRDLCGTLRVFLRYLHREGVVRIDLGATVESPQAYRLATIPRSITWDEVRRVLDAVDRATLRR